MTETQRKFLTEYLGLIYHEIVGETKKGTSLCSCGRSGMDYWDICVKGNIHFDTAQDKQDLLMAIIEKGEWSEFHIYAVGSCPSNWNPEEYTKWLIQLSPEKTAELICRWKGIS